MEAIALEGSFGIGERGHRCGICSGLVGGIAEARLLWLPAPTVWYAAGMWWASLVLASELPQLSVVQQRQDHQQLWDALEQMHPSLDLYTPTVELKVLQNTVWERLDAPRSALGFWALEMEAISAIGCGHTHVEPGPAALHAVAEASALFPLDLVVVDEQLHLDPRTHPEGGRLVSVQGVSAQELLHRMRTLRSSDGLSTGLPDLYIDELAPLYVASVLGPRSTYATVIERDGLQREELLDGARTPSGRWGSDPGHRGARARFLVSAIDLHTGAPTKRSSRGDPDRAVLVAFDHFPRRGLRRRILRPMLRALRTAPAGLILDLRRNGGGSPWPALELVGHLVPDDVPSYDQRLVRWSHLQASAGEDPFVEQLTERYRHEGRLQGDLLDLGYGAHATIEARAPHYGGPLVVLTSAETFSTAADTAAFLVREGRAHVIGETTGGSATLQTSGQIHLLWLTHSGVSAQIPLYRSRLADPEGTFADQIGVEPHERVRMSLEDLREGNDPALAAALGYLSRATRQAPPPE